jgi:hypothetical protein
MVNKKYAVNPDIMDVSIEELEETRKVLIENDGYTEKCGEEMNVIGQHILYMYKKQGKKTFTEEEFENDMSKEILGYILGDLVGKGELEENIREDGEIVYQVKK